MKESTLEKIKELRFYGMYRGYKNLIETGTQNMTSDETLAHLIEIEYDDRYNRRLNRLITQAKFRYNASFQGIDYSVERKLDKNLISRLSSCSWITKGKNIIITGPTGVGKSYIACAIGQQCCMNNLKVKYFQANKLFSFLKFCKADDSYIKEINNLNKQDLIILDDFGLKFFDDFERLSLLEILEDRYNSKSVIVSSQVPVEKWHDIIGDSTIADAICDRIIHNSYRIELKGESMRKILKE